MTNFTKSTRARLKKADNLRRQIETPFKEIDMSTRAHPSWMTRAFANNRYIVMIMDHAPTDKGNAIRAMIQTTDDRPIHNHWSEIQRIKNEIFGPECVAVEYYPAESKLVDDFNIYWIWIFPEGLLPIPITP